MCGNPVEICLDLPLLVVEIPTAQAKNQKPHAPLKPFAVIETLKT